jgi:DUF2891 family protein
MRTIVWLVSSFLLVLGCSRQSPPSGPAAKNTDLEQLLNKLPDKDELKLDQKLASRFAGLSLGCIDREYPNKPSNILDGDQTVLPPRKLSPAFFGCFDWHSAVHGHWALIRLLKTFPGLPEAQAIRKKLGAHLTAEKFAAELAYFKLDRNRTFERPYGWGWLLRLAGELHTFDDADAKLWSTATKPLADFLAQRTIDYLDKLSVPVREGTHSNTAFALVHALDYARAVGDNKLSRAIERRAMDFFSQDKACPTAYEPSGEDFISPCLAEADLMRRVFAQAEFIKWLDAFLPALDSDQFAPLRRAVEVKDIKDPKIGHLIGLALQRAWCFKGIAAALPQTDMRRAIFAKLARLHRHEALRQMFESGYGGEHWLASFAIYLMTAD